QVPGSPGPVGAVIVPCPPGLPGGRTITLRTMESNNGMPGRWPGIPHSGWTDWKAKLAGATPHRPGPLCADSLLAGEIGGLARPFGGHQVVAYPARHDHIPRHDPQLTAFSRFAFNDIAGSDGEPRGKPRLRGHDNRSINPTRNANTTNADATDRNSTNATCIQTRNTFHGTIRNASNTFASTSITEFGSGCESKKSRIFGGCVAVSLPTKEHGRK